MTACPILYFDPAQVGRVPVDPFGEQAGPACDGWRHCPAPGRGWQDPTGQWRLVCPTHQRQLTALHAAGQAARVRWAGQPATRPPHHPPSEVSAWPFTATPT